MLFVAYRFCLRCSVHLVCRHKKKLPFLKVLFFSTFDLVWSILSHVVAFVLFTLPVDTNKTRTAFQLCSNLAQLRYHSSLSPSFSPRIYCPLHWAYCHTYKWPAPMYFFVTNTQNGVDQLCLNSWLHCTYSHCHSLNDHPHTETQLGILAQPVHVVQICFTPRR